MFDTVFITYDDKSDIFVSDFVDVMLSFYPGVKSAVDVKRFDFLENLYVNITNHSCYYGMVFFEQKDSLDDVLAEKLKNDGFLSYFNVEDDGSYGNIFDFNKFVKDLYTLNFLESLKVHTFHHL